MLMLSLKLVSVKAGLRHFIVIIAFSFVLFCSCGSDQSKNRVTAEKAYEGVSNYCHDVYDWSVAEENPSMMYIEMGEESDSTYEVVFRSYTGALVLFFVDKTTGATRMVEKEPLLNIENEAGTINVLDYLKGGR